MNKIKRIMKATTFVASLKTVSFDDKAADNSYCVGRNGSSKTGKKFNCCKCKTIIRLSDEVKKLVEQKRGKPICVKCALELMQKTKKFGCSIFEKDKARVNKMLDEHLEKELDNLVPFEGC